MSLLNLQSPGFLNKKIHVLQIFKIQVDRPDYHSGKYIRLYPTSFPIDPLYLYDFESYKSQKNTQKY